MKRSAIIGGVVLSVLSAIVLAQDAGTFTDKRDGKVYRTVKIGSQVWFAENLNYAAKGSVCYDDKPENCETYGRLYYWNTALTACPAGSHLPDTTEWQTLVDYAGGDSIAGTKLKSKTGWERKKGVPTGTDVYGFMGLPGGGGYRDTSFGYVGNIGYWWDVTEDATEGDTNHAYDRSMGYNFEAVSWGSFNKSYQLSVRCVQDTGGQK